MKLSEYMKMANVSDVQFGRLIGKDRTSVSRYRRGLIDPPLDVLARIEDATSRAVTFRDFVGA